MKCINLAIFLLVAFFSGLSYSTEYLRTVEIKTLHPIAEIRPVNTQMQNSTRIYFKQSAGWADIGCRNDAADLKASDSHLLSILLFAWASEKQITVDVDNTLKPDGEVCQVTALVVE